ncbi:hypothetical protein ACRRTK_009622 [Alexandromys fortis]
MDRDENTMLPCFSAWRHSSVINCRFFITFSVLCLTSILVHRSFEFCGNQISVAQVQ